MAPPVTSSPADATANSGFADIYAKDEEILSTLATRKDMRRNMGLVRFSAGEIDGRNLAHNQSWLPSEDEKGDVEEDGIDAASPEGNEDDWISDEDEEEEEEEEEEITQPPSGKRNRKRSATEAAAARPTKKVAFAIDRGDLKSRRVSDALAPAQKKSLRGPPILKDKKGVPPKEGKVANVGAGPKVVSKGEAYDFSQYF
jgi:nuclear GTP-binding protein